MEKTKVTGKEFKSLLKELEIEDIKNRGYGYILLIIVNQLYDDARSYKESGCNCAYESTLKQIEGVRDFLKAHGYYQNL